MTAIVSSLYWSVQVPPITNVILIITSVIILEKFLLALKSLLKSIKINPNHATLYEQLVRFRLAVEASGSEIKANTKIVLDEHWNTLYHGKDLKAFAAEFEKKNVETNNPGSVDHVIAAAMVASLTEKEVGKAEKLLFLVEQDRFKDSQTLENTVLVLKTLRSIRSSRAQEFKAKAHAWFPLATVFKP